jgi:hypothetical protein
MKTDEYSNFNKRSGSNSNHEAKSKDSRKMSDEAGIMRSTCRATNGTRKRIRELMWGIARITSYGPIAGL